MFFAYLKPHQLIKLTLHSYYERKTKHPTPL